jgi:hypothetical protein
MMSLARSCRMPLRYRYIQNGSTSWYSAEKIVIDSQPVRRERVYDVVTYWETFCSLSTLFLTVGRFIIRSCHAV